MPKSKDKDKPADRAGPKGPWKYTPEFVEGVEDRLLQYAARPPRKDENNMWCDLTVVEFAMEEGISYQRFADFSARSESFSASLREAKRMIGMKRERLGLNKSLDSTYVKLQAMYDPEYKELISWLKESEQNISKSMGAIKEFIEACKDKK